jgi:hypothetical protein
MDQTVEYIDWVQTITPTDCKVCVIGAGPSMNRYDRDTFTKLYDIVIGVNWMYLNFDVTYNVATHYFIVDRVFQLHDCPCLVYSSSSPDTLHQFYSPKAPGIRFCPEHDLVSGSSTIISAMHLATLLTTRDIDVFGCDLTYGDKMYFDGYYQEDKRQPDRETFDRWSQRVKDQIDGLENYLKRKFNLVK